MLRNLEEPLKLGLKVTTKVLISLKQSRLISRLQRVG